MQFVVNPSSLRLGARHITSTRTVNLDALSRIVAVSTASLAVRRMNENRSELDESMNRLLSNKWLASVMLAAIPVSAFALDCDAPSGGVGLEAARASLTCAERDAARNDKALNEAYGRLNVSLGSRPDERDALRTAQRAWIAFRDAECDLRAIDAGGAPQWVPVNRMQCVSELTAERAAQLRSYRDGHAD